MEKILSEHARKRKQLRIETATILVNEFGKPLTMTRVFRTHPSTDIVIYTIYTEGLTPKNPDFCMIKLLFVPKKFSQK